MKPPSRPRHVGVQWVRGRWAIWAGAVLINTLLAVGVVVRLNGFDRRCADADYIFGPCDIAYFTWTGLLIVFWVALDMGLALFWWIGRRRRG